MTFIHYDMLRLDLIEEEHSEDVMILRFSRLQLLVNSTELEGLDPAI